MGKMAATRNRKEDVTYKKYLKTLDPKKCVFCDIKKGDEQFIKQTKYSKVIKNIFPYSLWELIDVKEHLMITPVRHTGSLGDLNDKEALDYMKLLQEYEAKGYNLYSRAPDSPTKSIPHQHMHLIKTAGKPRRFVVHAKKPIFRITVR